MFEAIQTAKLCDMSTSVTNITRKPSRPPGPNNRANDGKNQSPTRALTATSLSGLNARMIDGRLSELGGAMLPTADEITQALGGYRPGA